MRATPFQFDPCVCVASFGLVWFGVGSAEQSSAIAGYRQRCFTQPPGGALPRSRPESFACVPWDGRWASHSGELLSLLLVPVLVIYFCYFFLGFLALKVAVRPSLLRFVAETLT